MEMVDEREIGIVQMSKSLFHLEYTSQKYYLILQNIVSRGFLLSRQFSKKMSRYCHSPVVTCVVVQKLGTFLISLALL